MSIKKSVVLFSGNGSNLKNLIEKSEDIKDKLKYVAAFTNNPKAGGINICHNLRTFWKSLGKKSAFCVNNSVSWQWARSAPLYGIYCIFQ